MVRSGHRAPRYQVWMSLPGGRRVWRRWAYWGVWQPRVSLGRDDRDGIGRATDPGECRRTRFAQNNRDRTAVIYVRQSTKQQVLETS